MGWLRLDDKFAQHPKIAELSDRAFRVHVETMLYCAEYATAGRIPRASLKMANATEKVIRELVENRVWDRDEEGQLLVHDFAIYNGKTIAERVEAYLKRFPGTSANEVHRALGGKREVVLAEVSRFQGGSQSGSEGTAKAGTPGTAKAVPSVRARGPGPIPVETPPAPPGGRRLGKKELRRFTGCRETRGSHGIGHEHTPLGTDKPPANWPHERPTESEVLAALNGSDPEAVIAAEMGDEV